MYDLKASMYLRFISDKSFNEALSHKLHTLFLVKMIESFESIKNKDSLQMCQYAHLHLRCTPTAQCSSKGTHFTKPIILINFYISKFQNKIPF